MRRRRWWWQFAVIIPCILSSFLGSNRFEGHGPARICYQGEASPEKASTLDSGYILNRGDPRQKVLESQFRVYPESRRFFERYKKLERKDRKRRKKAERRMKMLWSVIVFLDRNPVELPGSVPL